MKKVLSFDPFTGKKLVATDDGDGGLIIQSSQDVTAILEQNKAEYNMKSTSDRWGDMTKVASLPYQIVDTLNQKGIMRGFAVVNETEFRKFLNDPENRFFRTRPGRV